MVYLPEKDYFSLRLLSMSERRPMAELVREFVDNGLSKKSSLSGLKVLNKLGKYKIKGGKNLSGKVDEIYR